MLLHPDAYLKAKQRLNDQFAAEMAKPPFATVKAWQPFRTLPAFVASKIYSVLQPRIIEPQAPIVTRGDKVRCAVQMRVFIGGM